MTLVAVVAGLVATALVALRRRLMVVTVVGDSMVPAYRPGDRLLVARGAASVSAGDVVVFTGGRRGHAGQVVKRVAAVPGDLVPVSVLGAVGARTGQVVPPGRLVVLGDGVTSVDSREWGYLPAARLTGRVLRKLG
ncbi:S26 family signal peptidase [Actinoplanes sp. NPDC051343]|uniref:S26 family signal peptidase n=1 Tax=Actinoplanes sp. NPDC051343 TaxID=3363906 RepID=UPI0037B5504C